MSEAIVQLKQVSSGYGEKKVLSHLDLEIMPGDFLAIIGPNGCGKSTLLKTILGIIPIQSGERNVLGKKNPKPEKMAGKISYIPQRLKLNQQIPLSVKEFLNLKLNYSLSESDIIHALESVNLKEKLDASIHELSGGQLQRIFFAFTMLSKPSLICLDEATEGMDSKSESNFFKLLKEDVNTRQSALILISHDISAVTDKANRVLCMKEGEFFETRPQDPNFHSCLHKIYGEDKFIHDHKHNH